VNKENARRLVRGWVGGDGGGGGGGGLEQSRVPPALQETTECRDFQG